MHVQRAVDLDLQGVAAFRRTAIMLGAETRPHRARLRTTLKPSAGTAFPRNRYFRRAGGAEPVSQHDIGPARAR